MTKKNQQQLFEQTIKGNYQFKGAALNLGAAVYADQPIKDLLVAIPLATLNRHGLIAGATGTGKTRTLQKLAEGLSSQGCPVLLMDIKGDLSGIAAAGESNKKMTDRQQQIGTPWQPKSFPVEFLSISNEKGARLRATISEFGPVLFARILELNDTQAGVVSLIFKYCDDQHLPLLDIKDFKAALQYLTNEGKETIKSEYGAISGTSAATITRKLIELEQQGADLFFGEKSFDVADLLSKASDGRGTVNILRLTDMQNKPKLFSTFMLCLLAEIYNTFPEIGDPDKPKLVIFIDEAHLIFEMASKALLNQIESIVKLIRSKGVGIYFCTQNPADVPDEILSQLGLKIQHSLRAFTAKDRKAIKLAAENYPNSDFYNVSDLLTALGIGEALVTALDEKGTPTPLVQTLMSAPESSMGILTESDLDKVVGKSNLAAKYAKAEDRDSAYEMLNKKIAGGEGTLQTTTKTSTKAAKTPKQSNIIEEIAKSPMAKQVGRTLAREITRGIFGVLKK